MSIITPALSKQVGWILAGHLNFPTIEEIRNATHYQLFQWYRFLPSPSTDEQIKSMALINYRVHYEEAAEISESLIAEAVKKWKASC